HPFGVTVREQVVAAAAVARFGDVLLFPAEGTFFLFDPGVVVHHIPIFFSLGNKDLLRWGLELRVNRTVRKKAIDDVGGVIIAITEQYTLRWQCLVLLR